MPVSQPLPPDTAPALCSPDPTRHCVTCGMDFIRRKVGQLCCSLRCFARFVDEPDMSQPAKRDRLKRRRAA